MRRALPVFSGLLLVAGLELASGGLSESFGRIVRIGQDLFAGNPVGVYIPAYVVGLLGMALGVAGLGISAWTRFGLGSLSRGKDCPRCGGDTIRLRRKRRHRILARLREEEIQLRNCGECGWKGLARVA